MAFASLALKGLLLISSSIKCDMQKVIRDSDCSLEPLILSAMTLLRRLLFSYLKALRILKGMPTKSPSIGILSTMDCALHTCPAILSKVATSLILSPKKPVDCMRQAMKWLMSMLQRILKKSDSFLLSILSIILLTLSSVYILFSIYLTFDSNLSTFFQTIPSRFQNYFNFFSQRQSIRYVQFWSTLSSVAFIEALKIASPNLVSYQRISVRF